MGSRNVHHEQTLKWTGENEWNGEKLFGESAKYPDYYQASPLTLKPPLECWEFGRGQHLGRGNSWVGIILESLVWETKTRWIEHVWREWRAAWKLEQLIPGGQKRGSVVEVENGNFRKKEWGQGGGGCENSCFHRIVVVRGKGGRKGRLWSLNFRSEPTLSSYVLRAF